MSKYKHIKLEHDYVLIQIKSEMNEWCGEIKDENGKMVKLVINTQYRPTHHVRISGKVVAIPQRLSEYLEPLYELYPGCPRPLQARDTDQMQKQLNAMPPKYRKTSGLTYICGGFLPKFKTLENEPIEIPVGATIYFHYNTLLKPENYIERLENGDLLYRVPYTSVFCYVIKEGDDPIMLNNYCLVTPYIDEETKEIEMPNGSRIFGRMKGNLVVSLEREYRYLTGVLRHIGRPIGPDHRKYTQPGSLIMYRPSSEFVNNIEGTAYYVMRSTDIVAEWMEARQYQAIKSHIKERGMVIDASPIIPVGDYVMVSPELQSILKQSKQIIFDPHNPDQKFEQGDLFVPDSAFTHDKKKKLHKFGQGEVLCSGELCKKDRRSETILYEKSGYYLYVEEFNVVFVREGDIYGSMEGCIINT